MRSVLRHEIVHALRDLCALSDGDWEVLAARAWGLDTSDIRTRYADRSEEARIEEAVAEAYRRWSENRLETDAHCGTASYASAASGNRQDGRWRPATLRCFPALLATINSISLQTSV